MSTNLVCAVGLAAALLATGAVAKADRSSSDARGKKTRVASRIDAKQRGPADRSLTRPAKKSAKERRQPAADRTAARLIYLRIAREPARHAILDGMSADPSARPAAQPAADRTAARLIYLRTAREPARHAILDGMSAE